MLKVRLEGPISRQGYHALQLRQLHEFALANFFSFDLDTTELRLEDEFQRYAERGVRFSQPQEIEQAATELYRQAEDEAERELILAARDEILAYYSSER